MGTVTIPLVYPAPAAVFGAFMAIVIVYLLYRVAKFVISIWTGS